MALSECMPGVQIKNVPPDVRRAPGLRCAIEVLV